MSSERMDGLLVAAGQGDGRAFEALVAPLRPRLLGHCYRMLGALDEAEDAVQETLVRAWLRLGSFQGRSGLGTWLHAIATRVCLDALERRPPRSLPSHGEGAPSDPRAPPEAPVMDPVWLTPLPDRAWCREEELDARECPEATLTRRESVALAFLAALQLLPASQRAALLLREVSGLAATEVAEALGTSVASVNSALQRARGTLDARAGAWRGRAAPPADTEARALGAYVRAWESGDPVAFAAVLREDATFAMPPSPSWYSGREAVRTFFQGFVLGMGWRFRARLAPGANGAGAVAMYRHDPGGGFVADGVHLVTLDARGEAERVVAFLGSGAFAALGLPPTWEG